MARPERLQRLAHGSPEQIDRWLRPGLRGESQDAYAVTEEHAGSDPSGIATTATRVDGGWRIDGKKIFASLSGSADYYGILCGETKPGQPNAAPSGWKNSFDRMLA